MIRVIATKSNVHYMNNCPQCGKPVLTIGTLHFFKCGHLINDGGTLKPQNATDAHKTGDFQSHGGTGENELRSAAESLPTINLSGDLINATKAKGLDPNGDKSRACREKLGD